MAHHTSAPFCWPKQVTRSAPIPAGRAHTPPLNGWSREVSRQGDCYRGVINCAHECQQSVRTANIIFLLVVDLVELHTLMKHSDSTSKFLIPRELGKQSMQPSVTLLQVTNISRAPTVPAPHSVGPGGCREITALCSPGAQPRTGRGGVTERLWEFLGEVIFGLKLKFTEREGSGVYPRDLEVKMVVFSGKRAACREGQAWVLKDT